MTIDAKYTRRALLSRFGGTAAVAALYPLVPILEADAATTAGGSPLRYLYWYMPILPKSAIVASWLPRNQAQLEWTGAMSKLNDMADKMTCIRGLTNTAAYDSPLSGGHKASGMTMMSGWAARNNVANKYTHLWKGNNGFSGNSSLDQWLAVKLRETGVTTPRSDIRMGYENDGHTNDNVWKSISFKDGVMQYRHQYPDKMYDDIFDLGNNSQAVDYSGRLSVMNNTTTLLNRLKNKVSAADAQRLEAHLESISELERQLTSVNTTKSCDIPSGLGDRVDRWDRVVDNYIRLVTIAFNCDITRVAGAQWLSHLWDDECRFLGLGGGYHGKTHEDGNKPLMEAVQNFRAEVFIELMKSFDAIEEANGSTMLDNSIIHWFTDVARDHNWYDHCNIIAGGGGYFKMGVNHVQGGNHKRDDNRPQTMLLQSIIDAFGFDPGNFIDPKYDKGGLPNAVKV